MINSRDKGARGEREWRDFCREHGFTECRRGQQYNGIESEDVVGLPYIWQEVKRDEKLNVYNALVKAEGDAKEGTLPIVAHRKNRQLWMVTQYGEDWFKIYKCYLLFNALLENLEDVLRYYNNEHTSENFHFKILEEILEVANQNKPSVSQDEWLRMVK